MVAVLLSNGPFSPVTSAIAPVHSLLLPPPPLSAAIAVCRPGWVILVPELELEVDVVQPPCEWIATARPVLSAIITEPELPPHVSTP